MALASIQRVNGGPPPLPVSLRLEATRWGDLDRSTVNALKLNLTNNGARGDLKDDGVPAGSLFRKLIDDAQLGIANTSEWWAVTAWPGGSLYAGPVAWCLLRPEVRHLPTLRTGFYTGPQWRARGIARLLNNEAARLAHQLGYKRLVASPWNARSLAFFRAAGYGILCTYGGGMSSLAEMEIDEKPARLPWRCRLPEATT